MSWIDELYNTYNNCYGTEEVSPVDGKKTKKPLLPPFHTLQNSHIEVRIDGKANFIDAVLIENKNEQEIIIPCTEKSSSRTSGEEPHPLCDKIQYCAKDYIGIKKSYFNSYSKRLEKWANSDFSHPMVQVIYAYVKKGTLFNDIIGTGKQFGKPGEDFADFLIRWRVEMFGEKETRCWKSHNLFNSWQLFSESQESVEDICMVTGLKKSIALNHPKRIRNSGDGAKLISSNDKTGFTFLGRFKLNDVTLNGEKEEIAVQSASISVEVSQKAHSALRWLIDRQGFRNGDQVIVSWAVSGQPTPDPLSDTHALLDETDEEKINDINQISYHDAGQTFARKLSKKIAGYKADLKDASKIVVMGLDSAGPGRVSITYYRELTNSEFLERIEKWHTQMAWHFLEFFQDPINKKKKHSGYLVIAPAPRTIAEACYGKRLDDKLKKATIERLLPCIVEGWQVPIDLVDSSVKRASNKIGMEHWEWERTLSIACALYRCYSIRSSNSSNKNNYTMALENDRNDRDYLYGRLLAVAEYLEEKALYLAGENRITNAARLMQRFSDQPFQTWIYIEKSLDPYKTRLQVKRPMQLFFLKNLIDDIHNKFLPGDYEKEGRLSGLYLLGYHCQRLELLQKIDKEEKESKIENNL